MGTRIHLQLMAGMEPNMERCFRCKMETKEEGGVEGRGERKKIEKRKWENSSEAHGKRSDGGPQESSLPRAPLQCSRVAPERPLQKVRKSHWDLLKLLSVVPACDAVIADWCVLAGAGVC